MRGKAVFKKEVREQFSHVILYLRPAEVSDKKKRDLRHDYHINNAGENAFVLFRQVSPPGPDASRRLASGRLIHNRKERVCADQNDPAEIKDFGDFTLSLIKGHVFFANHKFVKIFI